MFSSALEETWARYNDQAFVFVRPRLLEKEMERFSSMLEPILVSREVQLPSA